MKILPFAPKAPPDVEEYLDTPEGTDSFMEFFLHQALVKQEEFDSMSWAAKKSFIRMYVADLERRKRLEKNRSS